MALHTKFIVKSKSAITCITLVVQILHLFTPFLLVSTVRAQETITPTAIISTQLTPSLEPTPSLEDITFSPTPSSSPIISQEITISPSLTTAPSLTPAEVFEVTPTLSPASVLSPTSTPTLSPTPNKTYKYSIPSLKVQFTKKEGKKFVYVKPTPQVDELPQYRDSNRKVFVASQKEVVENISEADLKSKKN